jgi:hypothetical protein
VRHDKMEQEYREIFSPEYMLEMGNSYGQVLHAHLLCPVSVRRVAVDQFGLVCSRLSNVTSCAVVQAAPIMKRN